LGATNQNCKATKQNGYCKQQLQNGNFEQHLQYSKCKTTLQSSNCKTSIAKQHLQNNCKPAIANSNCKAAVSKQQLQTGKFKHQFQQIGCTTTIKNNKCLGKALKHFDDPHPGKRTIANKCALGLRMLETHYCRFAKLQGIPI